jgi:hypothetical protein
MRRLRTSKPDTPRLAASEKIAPPRNAPAMPPAIVPTMPPGNFPGRSQFTRIPTIVPSTIQLTMLTRTHSFGFRS